MKNLIQEINAGGVALKKRMDYDYDLVSGKVNYFYYQKDKEDQLIHKYEYDGDNRIVKVFTSRDAITWDRDAKYDYYAHGPLAKTTIGEHEVETNTYAYTIQGWIKGVNGNSFSYALGYFDENVTVGTESIHYLDYTSIGTSTALGTPIATGKSLFNGNIATMASKTPQFASQGGADWVQQFEYDQLNRITASSTLEGATVNNKWKTGYEYDAGGNITNLKRWDAAGTQFDEMDYNYENTASGQNYKTNTNKLRSVDDELAFAGVHTSDIDDQDVGNYTYDEIGNLIADKSEEIENIEWTVYNKVKKVTRTATSTKPDLEFTYDAALNRAVKTVKEKSGAIKNTYYVYDASGNSISIYESNGGSLSLSEQFIYGAGRFGKLKSTNNNSNIHSVGQKDFEINDHLGNVRTTVSDLKSGGIVIVLSANDYLPFGMLARSFDNREYRFGYGGHEKMDELNGEGNSIDMGFRYLDVRLGRTSSMDNFCAKYPGISPFAYALNTPLSAIDPDGNLIIFIGGLRLKQNDADQAGSPDAGQNGGLTGIYSSDVFLDENGEGYWHKNSNSFGEDADLASAFMERIGDNNDYYTSGSSKWRSQAADRQLEGKAKAEEFHCMAQDPNSHIKLESGETIKIVAHSHGGAHAIGFAEQLMTYKNADGSPMYNIEVIYEITPHQPTDIDMSKLVGKIKVVQYSHPSDAVSSDDPLLLPNGGSKFGEIPGVSEFDGRDIMNENTNPKGTGIGWNGKGNRSGHNVTDNTFIFTLKPNEEGYVAPRLDSPQQSSGGGGQSKPVFTSGDDAE